MRRIFLDVDGVLADFDGAFASLFGKEAHECESKNEMWRLIRGHDEFFYNLPLMEGAKDLFSVASLATLYGDASVIILTSAGSSNYRAVAEQKKHWVRQHINKDVMTIAVKDGLDKAAFVQNKGDILVDDWRKNCEAWEEAGGVAIKYETATQAIFDLYEELRERIVA